MEMGGRRMEQGEMEKGLGTRTWTVDKGKDMDKGKVKGLNYGQHGKGKGKDQGKHGKEGPVLPGAVLSAQLRGGTEVTRGWHGTVMARRLDEIISNGRLDEAIANGDVVQWSEGGVEYCQMRNAYQPF